MRIDELELTVKALRVNLSSIQPYSTTLTVNNPHLDRDLNLGRAWLGKFLQEAGQPYPYEKDENRKEVKDIKPLADTSEEILRIDIRNIPENSRLRAMLERIANTIRRGMTETVLDRWKCHALENAYSHICNARMTLGYILGEIRDSNGS